MQQRIVRPYHLDIALEQRVVSDIEPYQRGIQEDVRLSDVAPEQVRRVSWL